MRNMWKNRKKFTMQKMWNFITKAKRYKHTKNTKQSKFSSKYSERIKSIKESDAKNKKRIEK